MDESVLIVGSLAYDTVTSPAGSVENELGGSATYGGLAAAFHSRISNGGSVATSAPRNLLFSFCHRAEFPGQLSYGCRHRGF